MSKKRHYFFISFLLVVINVGQAMPIHSSSDEQQAIERYLQQHSNWHQTTVTLMNQLDQWQIGLNRLSPQQLQQMIQAPKNVALPSLLPIAPTGLQLLNSSSDFNHAVPIHSFGQVIFLVGGDSYSANWLLQYRQFLMAHHATGYCIDSRCRRAVIQHLRQIVGGLPIIAINAAVLIAKKQITHYPTIIFLSPTQQH